MSQTFDMRGNGFEMGSHLILNLYRCEVSKLQDLNLFSHFAGEVLLRCNAQVVRSISHKFPGPGFGFTALYLLTTSHFSIHTWPENGSAAIDVFTCGDVSSEEICSEMAEYFGAGESGLASVTR